MRKVSYLLVAAMVTSVMAMLPLGCMPPPVATPANESEMGLVLSELVLDPEKTCAELQEDFRLEYIDLPATPDELGLAWEEYFIESADGTIIRVWYLPSALDRGLVVQSQGASGIMPCYLFVPYLLVQNGWSVVVWDYRGFGGSTGEPDIAEFGTDLQAVVDFGVNLTGHPAATLVGISLGSIPSVDAAVALPDKVNAVVLDSPAAMESQIERLSFALREQTEAFLQVLAPSLLTQSLVADMHQPLLVFLHEYDYITPPRTVQDIYDRAAGEKEIVRFELPHARGPYYATGTYEYHLERFLSRVWGQGGEGVVGIVGDGE